MTFTLVQPGDREQARETARQVAAVLEAGGLVVFPTETVYGVAASAARERGIHRLRELKAQGRPRAFPVHLAEPDQAGEYLDLERPGLRRLVNKLWPGPITLVGGVDEADIPPTLASLGLEPTAGDRLYEKGRIALRCPDHEPTRRMLAEAPAPVVAGTVRTRSGSFAREGGEAADAVGEAVDLVVDGGPCRYGRPSTVVRLGGKHAPSELEVEREGVYDERFLRKLMRWTVLMVCSGNTCRSPMAEGLARRLLAEQRGIDASALESAGVRVVSAGLHALAGMPATPEGVQVLAEQGIDLSSHRSRPVNPELIHEADVIYTMTHAQRQALVGLDPSAEPKTLPLDPEADVEDPIGTDAGSYQRMAERIRRLLNQRLKEPPS